MRRPKVLLVDDEPKICAALAGALVSEGFDVLFEESGDEAIHALEDCLFDIVLMDLRMPGKSGWETFAELAWSHPLLPVIIITALPAQQAPAKAAGVGALLEKPLDIPLLLDTMHRLLAEPVFVRVARLEGYAPAAPPDPRAIRGSQLNPNQTEDLAPRTRSVANHLPAASFSEKTHRSKSANASDDNCW